jgi:hypothetical protein
MFLHAFFMQVLGCVLVGLHGCLHVGCIACCMSTCLPTRLAVCLLVCVTGDYMEVKHDWDNTRVHLLDLP